MVALLKLLLLRWFATKTYGGVLALLAVLALPVAGVLKVIGLPLLIVLGIVALPIALVLGVLVVGAVGVIVAALGAVLSLGLLALKLALPVLLVVFVVWLVRRIFRRDKEPAPADTMGAAI